VLEAGTLGPDPGARALLELANSVDHVLSTIDTTLLGILMYLYNILHAELLRPPDVSAEQRIALVPR